MSLCLQYLLLTWSSRFSSLNTIILLTCFYCKQLTTQTVKLFSASHKRQEDRLEINWRQVFFVLQCLAELKPMVGLTTVPRSTKWKTQTINNTGNSKKSFIAGGASHLTLNSKDRILREKEGREREQSSIQPRKKFSFILWYWALADDFCPPRIWKMLFGSPAIIIYSSYSCSIGQWKEQALMYFRNGRPLTFSSFTVTSKRRCVYKLLTVWYCLN